MSDIVGFADAFVSDRTAQATAMNDFSLRFHRQLWGTAQSRGYGAILEGQIRAGGTPPTGSLPGKLSLL